MKYSTQVTLSNASLKTTQSQGETYTVTGDFTGTLLGGAADGCVAMLVVPAGAKIIGGYLEWGALGGSTQLFVGDFWVCNRFMTRADGSIGSEDNMTAATFYATSCGRFNNILGRHYVTTCDLSIIVSNLSGVATSTAVGTATPLVLQVQYTYV